MGAVRTVSRCPTWMDCAANRRLPWRAGSAGQQGDRRAGSHRFHHRPIGPALSLLRTARRGAAGRPTSRRAAPVAGGGQRVAALGLAAELRAALHRESAARSAARRGRQIPHCRAGHVDRSQRRDPRHRLVFRATRVRDPGRHGALDRRAAEGRAAHADRCALRRAQRRPWPCAAARRHTAGRLGRTLHAARALSPAAAVGAHGQLAELERPAVCRAALHRRASPRPLRGARRPHPRRQRRGARLGRRAQRPVRRRHGRPGAGAGRHVAGGRPRPADAAQRDRPRRDADEGPDLRVLDRRPAVRQRRRHALARRQLLVPAHACTGPHARAWRAARRSARPGRAGADRGPAAAGRSNTPDARRLRAAGPDGAHRRQLAGRCRRARALPGARARHRPEPCVASRCVRCQGRQRATGRHARPARRDARFRRHADGRQRHAGHRTGRARFPRRVRGTDDSDRSALGPAAMEAGRRRQRAAAGVEPALRQRRRGRHGAGQLAHQRPGRLARPRPFSRRARSQGPAHARRRHPRLSLPAAGDSEGHPRLRARRCEARHRDRRRLPRAR